MIDDLTPLMTRLPDPTPPPTLTATVMARIARERDRRTGADAAVPVRRHRDRSAWIWTFVGVALVLGVSIYGWRTAGSMPDFTSSRIGFGRPAVMPIEGPVSLLLGLGLLIYLAGLFAPLSSGDRE